MQNNTKAPDISVVVLCYKTKDFAREFSQKIISMLEKENIDYELILVGNYHLGSNDRTPDVVKSLAKENPQIIAIAKPKEGMMSWDMRTGFEASRGKYIVVIDGDGQMPYQDILRVYKMIKSGNFDLCKTYRVERHDSIYRNLISIIYNFVFSIIFYPGPGRDINSKPKIITREAYKKLKLTSNGWFIDAEIMIQAWRFAFRIGEIPTIFNKNVTRKYSHIRFSAIWEFIKNIIIFRIREFRYKR